jgi:hypothetical protein
MYSVFTIREGKIQIPNAAKEHFFPLMEAITMKENDMERGFLIPMHLRDTIGNDMSQYNDDEKEDGKWKYEK